MKAIPVKVRGGVMFGLVMVIVRSVLSLNGNANAPKVLVIVGGTPDGMVNVAVAGGPFPALEVTGLVVLRKVPGVVPALTVTGGNVQFALGARVPPVNVMVVAVAESVPPQVDMGGAMGVTETPVGVSVKPIPVRAVFKLGFVMVNVNVEVPPVGTLGGL